MLAEFTVETAQQVKSLWPGAVFLHPNNGILAWKAEAVEAAYTGLGFEVLIK